MVNVRTMLQKLLCIAFFLSDSLMPKSALGKLTLHIGPASRGGGGPNPLSIPPTNILNYGIVWFSESHREISASIYPGIFYGYRESMKNGAYVSLGSGLVINLHGIGPGVVTAFGYDSCGYVCFNIEYRQAFGLLTTMTQSPYALRVGLTFDLL